jgi:beta-phosphoglucomutase-like phosphatase (HAD superfamily)
MAIEATGIVSETPSFPGSGWEGIPDIWVRLADQILRRHVATARHDGQSRLPGFTGDEMSRASVVSDSEYGAMAEAVVAAVVAATAGSGASCLSGDRTGSTAVERLLLDELIGPAGSPSMQNICAAVELTLRHMFGPAVTVHVPYVGRLIITSDDAWDPRRGFPDVILEKTTERAFADMEAQVELVIDAADHVEQFRIPFNVKSSKESSTTGSNTGGQRMFNYVVFGKPVQYATPSTPQDGVSRDEQISSRAQGNLCRHAVETQERAAAGEFSFDSLMPPHDYYFLHVSKSDNGIPNFADAYCTSLLRHSLGNGVRFNGSQSFPHLQIYNDDGLCVGATVDLQARRAKFVQFVLAVTTLNAAERFDLDGTVTDMRSARAHAARLQEILDRATAASDVQVLATPKKPLAAIRRLIADPSRMLRTGDNALTGPCEVGDGPPPTPVPEQLHLW